MIYFLTLTEQVILRRNLIDTRHTAILLNLSLPVDYNDDNKTTDFDPF